MAQSGVIMLEIIIKSAITIVVSGFIGLIVKVVKDLATQKIAIQSLLRSEMVKVYYRYREDKKLPYYTKVSWYEDYEAYTKLGGNSFIRDLKEEIDKWEVE